MEIKINTQQNGDQEDLVSKAAVKRIMCGHICNKESWLNCQGHYSCYRTKLIDSLPSEGDAVSRTSARNLMCYYICYGRRFDECTENSCDWTQDLDLLPSVGRINIALNETQSGKLDKIAEALGRDLVKIYIEDAVMRLIHSFEDRDHEVVLRPAQCEGKGCYVISETTIYSKPYYRIWIDGEFKSAPAESISFPEETAPETSREDS